MVAELLNTIDYVMDDETVVFRTCSAERGKIVFQIVSYIHLYFAKFLIITAENQLKKNIGLVYSIDHRSISLLVTGYCTDLSELHLLYDVYQPIMQVCPCVQDILLYPVIGMVIAVC